MALFRVTVKVTKIANGIRIEKGMSVDFPAPNTAPLSSNGGKEVVEAFKRKYGVDLKKISAVNSTYLAVERIG